MVVLRRSCVTMTYDSTVSGIVSVNLCPQEIDTQLLQLFLGTSRHIIKNEIYYSYSQHKHQIRRCLNYWIVWCVAMTSRMITIMVVWMISWHYEIITPFQYRFLFTLRKSDKIPPVLKLVPQDARSRLVTGRIWIRCIVIMRTQLSLS